MDFIKSCQFDFKKFNIDPESSILTMSGPVSTYGNMDAHGDIIEHGAFTKSIKQNPIVKLVVNHENHDFRGLIGKIKLYEKGEEVWGDATIKKDIPIVKDELMPRLEILSEVGDSTPLVDSFSVRIGKDAKVERLKNVQGGRYLFKEATIKDVSLVGFPANDRAKVAFIKSETEERDFLKKLEDVTSLRELEGLLEEDAQFSKKEAMTLISKIKMHGGDDTVKQLIKENNEFRTAINFLKQVQGIKNEYK